MSLADNHDIPWQPCSDVSWPAIQAKFAFDIVLGKMLQSLPDRSDDISVPYLKALNIQWGKVISDDLPTMWANESEIEQLNLKINDLLVCEGGDVGRCATVSEVLPENCIFQNALHRVRPSERGNTRYLYYCLKMASETGWFDVICNRATIAHFTVEKFKELKIHLPSIDRQQLIANYLNRETTRIDTLITEKERMLTLLQEKRTALISQAVTRGLDPDVPLKPSGHFGYGDEPSKRDYGHAKKSNKTTLIPQYNTGDRRLRFLFDTVSGATPSSSVEKYWNGDIYWITPEDLGRLAGSELADTRRKISIEGYRNSGVELAPADSLIISKRAPIGQVAIVRVASTCNQGCFLLTKKSILDERFYYYTLIHLRPFLEILGRGSTFTELSSDDLCSIRLPFPDLNTQKDIADHIDRETTRIDILSKEISNSIKLLKERRSALITAAVTGQIDPKDMAA